MNRRQLIALGGGVLASTWSPPAWAQRPVALRRVGYLSLQNRPESLESDPNGEFLRAMMKLGYSEGKTISMEWRFAGFREDRLPQLAIDLVEAKVDAIVATTAQAVRAAQRATTTIPIAMAIAGNPVWLKLVPSLSKPSGNTTGVSSADPDRLPKQLEYLSIVVPSLKKVAYMTSRVGKQGPIPLPKSLAELANRLQISIHPVEAHGMEDVKRAFHQMKDDGVQALIQGSNPILNELRSLISDLALASRIASITTRREFVVAGGLMSYGESLSDFYHRAAKCVDRILKGAKPSDLPVELPTRISLDLNQRTAAALGLSFPAQLQVLADSIVE